MSDNRHEELARRLLDDQPSSWPEGLQPLRTEKKAMPEALRSKLSALNDAAIEEKRNEEKGNQDELNSRRQNRTRRLIAIGSLPAAAAAAILIYLGAIGLRTDTIPTTLTHVEGDVLLNEKQAATGNPVAESDSVTTKANALAVILSEDASTSFELRIRPDSMLKVDRLSPAHIQTRLQHGIVFGSLKHTNKGADLLLITPVSETSVVGTIFSLEQNETSGTSLTTYEGKVTFRRRWNDLEDLPEELFAKSKLLTEARSVMREAKAIVDAGAESRIDSHDFQLRLQKITALRTVLNVPQLTSLRNKKAVSDEELAAALKALNAAFPTEASQSAILSDVQTAFGQPPEVVTVQAEELQYRKEELSSLSTEERDRRFTELMSKGNLDKEAFKQKMTEVLGKAPQEVILKNGEHIFGSIFGEDGNYRVYTATGIRVVSPDEIEEILFQ